MLYTARGQYCFISVYESHKRYAPPALLFIALLTIVAIVNAEYCDSQWNMFGKDAEHTRSFCDVIETQKIIALWNYTTGGPVDSSPSIYDGVVYIGSNDGNLYALNANDGSLIWNYTTGSFIASSPAIDNEIVYIGSNDGNVYALNAADGTFVWNYTTGSDVYSSPNVFDNIVFIGSGDGSLYALNAGDGSLVWNYTTGGPVDSSPVIYQESKVIFGSHDGNVYALNAADGSFLWQYSTGDYVHSSPIVSNEDVFIGSGDGNLYALNANDGSLVWQFATNDIVHSSPAVSGNLVFIGSEDGSIYAIDASTGDLVWNHNTDYFIESSPAASDGLVFIGSNDGNMYAFNATGDLVWSYYTGGPVYSSPAFLDNALYFGSEDNKVYAFVQHTTGPYFINGTDQTLAEGQEFSQQIVATDIVGVSCFAVSDLFNFMIDCSGYLRNITELSPGLYIVEITANDTLNNPSILTIHVNIQEKVRNIVESGISNTVSAVYDVSSGFCVTKWTCNEWSECADNTQIRKCRPELSGCYADPKEKPLETLVCRAKTDAIPEQLFDISLGVEKTEIHSPDDLYATASFESFGSKPVPVDIVFSVLDSKGRRVYSKNDSLVVHTQEIINYGFSNLSLSEGRYVLRMVVSYSNTTNVYERDFEILETTDYSPLMYIVIVGILLIITAGIIRYMSTLRNLREAAGSKKYAQENSNLLLAIVIMTAIIVATKLLIGNKINIIYTIPLNLLFGAAAAVAMIAYFYKKPQLVKFSCIFALVGWAYENILEKLFFPNAVNHYFWSLDTTTSFFWLIFVVYVIKRYSK